MDGNPTTRISFNTGGAAGWYSQPVSVANGVGTVGIGQLPSGTFGYELFPVTGGTSYAQSTGAFSLSHAGVGIHNGSMMAHPGPINEVAVARWVAPSAGNWEVNIDFLSGGDTTRYVYVMGTCM